MNNPETEKLLLEIKEKIDNKAKELYELHGTDSYSERCGLNDAMRIVYSYTDKYKKEQAEKHHKLEQLKRVFR